MTFILIQNLKKTKIKNFVPFPCTFFYLRSQLCGNFFRFKKVPKQKSHENVLIYVFPETQKQVFGLMVFVTTRTSVVVTGIAKFGLGDLITFVISTQL